MTDSRSIVGKLLIAEPMLGDPNFDRTVVLIVEHTEDGALGVVLNRPTELEVGAVLSEWAELAASPTVLYLGGPVEQNGVLALARRRGVGQLPGWSPVIGNVGTIDLHREPVELAGDVEAVRFFAGYAGWGPGQLEAELEQGAWLVVEAQADDVFASDPDVMWRAVLRRQEGKVSMLAHFPAHPSMN
ncbi:MAG TPA: YqgE/AlgH family protein [Acidimicrobiales bacterium]